MHVRRDRQTTKFWLDPVALERSRGMINSELRQIERTVRENQTSFLSEWMHVSTTEVNVPDAMSIQGECYPLLDNR